MSVLEEDGKEEGNHEETQVSRTQHLCEEIWEGEGLEKGRDAEMQVRCERCPTGASVNKGGGDVTLLRRHMPPAAGCRCG